MRTGFELRNGTRGDFLGRTIQFFHHMKYRATNLKILREYLAHIHKKFLSLRNPERLFCLVTIASVVEISNVVHVITHV